MITFYKGHYEDYNPELHSEGIYFTDDTFEIIHDNQSYSGSKTDKYTKDINFNNGQLTIIYNDDTELTVEIGSGLYKSNIEDKTLTMPNAVGGIAKDTKLSDLEGKSYDSILDDLFFPTIYPTYSPPSATIKFIEYNAIQKVGSPAPAKDNFQTLYNPGSININGIKQNNRGGSLIPEESFIYTGKLNTTLPEIVVEGNVSYGYQAAYEDGPQPKDNKGNDYETYLSKGYVIASLIYVNGTYPWYATTDGKLTEQPLIAWSNEMQAGKDNVGFELQPHTEATPQQFKLPRKVKSIQMQNDVSKVFETVSIDMWEEKESIEQINGIDHTYYTYSYKGADRGSVKLIVKF